MNALQAFTEMQHGIAFAREQRIHAHAGCGGQVLEAAAFQFVSDEDVALIPGQFIERQLQLFVGAR